MDDGREGEKEEGDKARNGCVRVGGELYSCQVQQVRSSRGLVRGVQSWQHPRVVPGAAKVGS